MKKNYLFAVAIAAVFTGCSQDELVDFSPEIKSGFTATLETVDSRTALDANNKVQWVKDVDHVSLFEKVDINAKYQVSDVDANGTAKLTYVSYIENAEYQSLDKYYAVYPYSDANAIDESGTITAPVSDIYTFKDKESCIASALMVSRSDNKQLRFTNAQGIIRLKLNAETPYIWGKIQSVSFTSKGNYLNGTATMNWSTDTPLAEIKEGTEANKSLIINLDESLKKDLPSKQSNSYAEYYFPIVPTTFAEEDMTMTVKFANDKTYTKVIPCKFSVGRKEIITLKHTIGADDFSADIEDEVVSDEISNEAQLKKALQTGGKITLVNDITLTETLEVPEDITVTLDLNGKTIDYKAEKGIMIYSQGDLTLVGEGKITSTASAYAIRAQKGRLTIDSKSIEVIGAFGAVSMFNDAQVTINGGSYTATGVKGNTHHCIYVYSGADLTINDGTFVHNGAGISNSGATLTVYAGADGGATINGGTFMGSGTYIEAFDKYDSACYLTIKGGIFTKDPKNYLADGYKATKKDEKYYVTSNNVDGLITTANELAALGGTNINGTYMLMADLDMTGYDMKPVMLTSGSENKLTFNGNGHSISNLNLVQDYQNGMYVAGLFNILHSGSELTVNDLTLKNVISISEKYAAGVVAYNSTSLIINLDNVDVIGAEVTAETVAALVGYTTGNVSLTDCDVTNLTLTGEAGRPDKVGAYVGTANSANCDVTTNNCTNNTTYNDYGRVINGAKWNGVIHQSASSQESLNSAVATDGKVNVELAAGNYVMPSTNGDVTISGTKETIISGNDASAKKLTLDGITVQSTGNAYTGIKNSESVVYNDVTIVGNMYLYAEKVVFNECTFDLSNTNDYIWVYGATNVEFNNCIFNTMGKAILVFQDGSTVDQTVKVEGCTFNATQAAYNWDKTIHIAAVSIDGSQGGTYNVTLNNNTVDSDFNGLWQDKTSAGNITVIVDGQTELSNN